MTTNLHLRLFIIIFSLSLINSASASPAAGTAGGPDMGRIQREFGQVKRLATSELASPAFFPPPNDGWKVGLSPALNRVLRRFKASLEGIAEMARQPGNPDPGVARLSLELKSTFSRLVTRLLGVKEYLLKPGYEALGRTQCRELPYYFADIDKALSQLKSLTKQPGRLAIP